MKNAYAHSRIRSLEYVRSEGLSVVGKTLKYFCSYDSANKDVANRSYSLAAKNKIDYIKQVLNSGSIFVDIVSLSVGSKRSSYFDYLPSSSEQLDKLTTLRLFPSISSKSKIVRMFGKVVTALSLICYIIGNCKKDESVIVYHAIGYANLFFLMKKIKKIRLVLEVEEMYGDVTGSVRDRKKEDRLFKVADAFIFSTELLEEIINITHKPYAIVHGTYTVEVDRNFKFNDGLTHVVYAGVLDPRKGGAEAVAASMYLDSSFHIHILGFGNKEEEKNMRDLIDTIEKQATCLITFDGTLSGDEFIRFIQACDIGLSPQNPDAPFNQTSFPSKILTYLANGLKVVSIRIPAVERSGVGKMLYYYEEQTPQNIAEAIVSASKKQSVDSRKYLNKLDNDFKQSLLALFE